MGISDTQESQGCNIPIQLLIVLPRVLDSLPPPFSANCYIATKNSFMMIVNTHVIALIILIGYSD